MSDKLNIGNEMRQLDAKNRDFYDELTVEERRKFSTFLMVRWGSAVDGAQELQEYYVQSTNHYLNKHFFTMHRHPKLQWLMATAVSPGMGPMRHNWIAPKKKEAGASTLKKQLRELYPNFKDDEIDLMAQLNTKKDIDAYLRANGTDSKK
jgi:hypothetical protein